MLAHQIIRPPKALILDGDGVTWDTERCSRGAWVAASVEAGLDLAGERFACVLGRNVADGSAALLKEFGQTFPLAQIRQRHDEILAEQYAKSVPVKEGFRELIDYAKEHNIPVALGTNSTHRFVNVKFKGSGTREAFNAVVTCEDVPRPKPYPDIYLAAAAKLGIHPDDCLVGDDSPPGIESAYAGKIPSAFIEDLQRPNQRVREIATWMVQNLFEFFDRIKALVDGTGIRNAKS